MTLWWETGCRHRDHSAATAFYCGSILYPIDCVCQPQKVPVREKFWGGWPTFSVRETHPAYPWVPHSCRPLLATGWAQSSVGVAQSKGLGLRLCSPLGWLLPNPTGYPAPKLLLKYSYLPCTFVILTNLATGLHLSRAHRGVCQHPSVQRGEAFFENSVVSCRCQRAGHDY